MSGFLQQGLQLVKIAIQYDTSGNLMEAIRYYRMSLEAFDQATKVESDPNRASQIKMKMYEYSQRITTLLQIIELSLKSVGNQPLMNQQPSLTTSNPYPSSNLSQSGGIQVSGASPFTNPLQSSSSLPSSLSTTPSLTPISSFSTPSPYSTPHTTPMNQNSPSPYSNITSPSNTPLTGNAKLIPPTISHSAPESSKAIHHDNPVQTNPTLPNTTSPYSQASKTAIPPYQSSQAPKSGIPPYSSSTPSPAPSFSLPQSSSPYSNVSSPYATPSSSSTPPYSIPSNPSQTPSPFSYQSNSSPPKTSALESNIPPLPTSLPSQAPPLPSRDSFYQMQPNPSPFQSPISHTSSDENTPTPPIPQRPQSMILPSQIPNQPLPTPQSNPNPTQSTPPPTLLIKCAAEFPKTNQSNLQLSLMLLEEAKKEDAENHYQAALDIYTDALERLLIAYYDEANAQLKQPLLETIDCYMKRAEVIKESFSIAPNRVTDAMIQALEVTPPPSPLTHSNSNPTVPLASSNSQPNLPKERRPKLQKPPTSNSTSELRRIENNVDSNQIRDEVYDPNPPIGRPVQIANETKSLIGRQKLLLTVNLASNLVHPGEKIKLNVKVDNRSSMVVNFLKVILRRIEKSQKYDNKGKLTMSSDVVRVHRQEFYQGSIFPLAAESNYAGEIIYTIPNGLRPTNTYQIGVFEREYDLSIQCDLSLHKNLKVRFPLIVARGNN